MNTMKVVIAVDESIISDPHKLLDDFVESLSMIRDATDRFSKKNESS
jgi:WS/DGAT C-terminal domain